MTNSERRIANIQAIFSTAYLPPISYIRDCLRSETVIVEIHETYRKQTTRNHCLIAGPNGKQQLTIPVIKVNGNHTKTKDIRIADSGSWQRSHWRSIETAYNKSPFFLYYRDYFEPIYLKESQFLLDFNTKLLEVIFHLLKIEKKILFTDHFENRTIDPKPLDHLKYHQVFEEKSGFLNDLSIIDLIFNLGPEAGSISVYKYCTTD